MLNFHIYELLLAHVITCTHPYSSVRLRSLTDCGVSRNVSDTLPTPLCMYSGKDFLMHAWNGHYRYHPDLHHLLYLPIKGWQNAPGSLARTRQVVRPLAGIQLGVCMGRFPFPSPRLNSPDEPLAPHRPTSVIGQDRERFPASHVRLATLPRISTTLYTV